MSQTKIVTLKESLLVGGKELTEVTVRRANIGDEEDAMQAAVRMKRGNNPLSVEMCLMSKVTRLPYDSIRSLHDPDYFAIRKAMNELNGAGEENQQDDGENPMMPEEDSILFGEPSLPLDGTATGPEQN